MKELIEIQSTLNCPKNQRNTFGKYNYRNCEDIMEALKPLLLKNKCILTIHDSIELVGERYYVKATAILVNSAGDKVANTGYAREEENKKGMDSSQLTGATSSYARKYCLNGMFLIDDVKDADTDAFTEKTKSAQSTPKPQAKSSAPKPSGKPVPKKPSKPTPKI